MKWVVTSLLVAGAGCQLGPVSYEGLRCEPGDDCGEGLTCVDQRCAGARPLDGGHDAGAFDAGVDAGTWDAGDVDAGPVDAGIPLDTNLLVNGDFELLLPDGGVLGWSRSHSRLYPEPQLVHAGRLALRLQPTNDGSNPSLTPSQRVPGAQLGMKFCASAWARTDFDGGLSVSLTVRAQFPDGGTTSANASRVTLGTEWTQLKREYASLEDTNIDVVFTVVVPDAGPSLYVDDASLMRVEGPCP